MFSSKDSEKTILLAFDFSDVSADHESTDQNRGGIRH